MAITASVGVAVIILTNLVLVPVMVSYTHFDEIYRLRLQRRHAHMDPIWNRLARVTEPRNAAIVTVVAVLLFAFGWWKGNDVQVGGIRAGSVDGIKITDSGQAEITLKIGDDYALVAGVGDVN